MFPSDLHGAFVVFSMLFLAPFLLLYALQKYVFRISNKAALAWCGLLGLAYYGFNVPWPYYKYGFAKIAHECPRYWSDHCSIPLPEAASYVYWMSWNAVGFLCLLTSTIALLAGRFGTVTALDWTLKAICLAFAAWSFANLGAYQYMNTVFE